MTTPQLALTGLTAVRGAVAPLGPRLAYPALLVGLGLVLLGYAAVAVLLLRLVLGALF